MLLYNYTNIMEQSNNYKDWTAALKGAACMAPADLHGDMEKSAAAIKLAVTEILSISANIKAMHVNTGRYSQHMALDQAFSDLNGTVDTFNECVQGYYIMKTGSRLSLENSEVKFKLPGDDGVLDAVKGLCKRFEDAADSLVEGVAPLESVRDDVLNCFYQLVYRLDLKG